jgi:hypothetical protein
MRRILAALVALAFVALPQPSWALFQQQRAQRAITIVVNVQPGIAYRSLLRGLALVSPLGWFLPAGTLIAANQGSVKVNANVISDPNAGLLVLNNTQYTITQTAGTTATYACAFTVQANTTTLTSPPTTWTLQDGFASDFGAGFSANQMSWAGYQTPGSPPSPESFTQFINYYTNNKAWQLFKTGSGNMTFCVDLQLVLPAGLAPGQYSATAIYSLYY